MAGAARRIAVALGILAPALLGAQRETLTDSEQTRLAGFPPIAHDATTRGRELRVYVGFGLPVPDKFIRLVDDGDGGPIRGARGITWPSGLSAKIDRRGLDSAHRALVAGQRKQEDGLRRYVLTHYDCVELRATPDDQGCLLREPRPRDWGAVLRALDSLGVSDLPGKPKNVDELDGVALLVTVRDTRGYRVYSYWTPEATDPDAGTRAAAEIMRRVSALFAP